MDRAGIEREIVGRTQVVDVLRAVPLGILLPLSMIEDLVGERARFHEAAITDMARTATGNQRIVGPVLRVPCTETRSMPIAHPAEDGPRERSVERDCSVAVLPELLSVDGTLVTEEYLMTLEREVFCALVTNAKTQERIMGMMSTGKPVRN